MRSSKRWVSVIALGVSLFVVLELSFGSVALAQEAQSADSQAVIVAGCAV